MNIELEGVTVELGGRPVVDGVDLEVGEGEWIALIGPNGAGKTTLLRAIARLVPFAGSIALGGKSTASMAAPSSHVSSPSSRRTRRRRRG